MRTKKKKEQNMAHSETTANHDLYARVSIKWSAL